MTVPPQQLSGRCLHCLAEIYRIPVGHRQYWFTADTYTNVVPELAEAAAAAIIRVAPRTCTFMIPG